MAIALRYAARTHLGLGPKGRNEDSAYAGPHLLVLADGMGGHAAGDVASSMIVGALAPLDEEVVSGEQGLSVLEAELLDANTALHEAMQEDDALAGMGATTIAMLRSGSKLAMAHIGDSRAYLLREGVFSQITKDHSFVQQLLDEQRITDAEAQNHPQRSLVTRVMTGRPDDRPDLSIRELRVGDRYLLCSDGLTDFVSPDIVAEVLTGAESAADAAERCIALALKASTRDNVTVVVADVVDSDTEDDLPLTPEIVGAAAVRGKRRRRTRAIPVSPAEKAAALRREVSGAAAADREADRESDALHLAEESATPRVLWLRRAGLAAAATAVLVGGSYAGYAWTQRQYFLGEQDGYVAIYQGVNASLGPVQLSTVVQGTDVPLADLPSYYRDSVRTAITVSGLAEAAARVDTLRLAATVCRAQALAGIPCGTGLPETTPTDPSTSSPTDTSTLPVGATSPAGGTGLASLPSPTAYATVTIVGTAGTSVTSIPLRPPPGLAGGQP
ncbi:MAG: serine/threonine-protein phosphatase [Actinomycetales bacterium]|nr:serine/threonine-protein phosphatase [Actinomycetales bacterium]